MRAISLRVRWWKQGSPSISRTTIRGKLSGYQARSRRYVAKSSLTDRTFTRDILDDRVATSRVIHGERILRCHHPLLHLLLFIVCYCCKRIYRVRRTRVSPTMIGTPRQKLSASSPHLFGSLRRPWYHRRALFTRRKISGYLFFRTRLKHTGVRFRLLVHVI